MILKTLVVVLALTITISEQTQQHRSELPFQNNFNIGRGDAKLAGHHPMNVAGTERTYTQGTEECAYTMSRHHVIPFNTLRDFFNKGNAQSTNDRATHKVLYDFYLEDLIHSLSGRVTPEQPNFPTVNDADPIKAIVSNVAWLPFNLFAGPSGDNRSDDPDESFETGAGPIVGTQKLAELKSLYDDMKKYIRSAQPADFKNIVQRIVAKLPDPDVSFIENKWEYVRSKVVRNKKSRDQKIACEFRIKH